MAVMTTVMLTGDRRIELRDRPEPAPRMAAFPGSLPAVPASMGRYAAAWVEPTATALRAVGLAGDLTGADVLVTGGGPIGQLALRLSRPRGLGRLTLIEPSQQRRGFGAASGADESIDPAATPLAQGAVEVDDLTSSVSSLEASLGAFDSLRSASTMKVLISPHE